MFVLPAGVSQEESDSALNGISLHDVVFNVTGKSVKNEELESIFNTLPSHLKHLAYEWGMNDTVFRDDTYVYLKEKLENGENI